MAVEPHRHSVQLGNLSFVKTLFFIHCLLWQCITFSSMVLPDISKILNKAKLCNSTITLLHKSKRNLDYNMIMILFHKFCLKKVN